MNGRTAKLINRAAVANDVKPRVLKRAWGQLSRPKRARARAEMERRVEEHRAKLAADAAKRKAAKR